MLYGNSNNGNIILKNCFFRQEKISTNSTYAVFYAKDPSHITIDSCDFSGGSQMIHFRSNMSSHHDVHHIDIVHNYFHEINARLNNGNQYDGQYGSGIKMTMSYTDGVGDNLGTEGIVRDIKYYRQ